MDENQRLNLAPKWVNPCGLTDYCSDPDPDVARLSDSQLLRQIILQAKNALSHGKLFRDDFIKKTFNADFVEFHDSWKSRRYDWLPSIDVIPKNLGDNLDEQFLNHLQLEAVLLNSYEYLQKFAVGLEQIVWDQEDRGLQFFSYFRDAEIHLRSLLCEIQVALLEKGIDMRPDVTRDVMPLEHRSMSTTTHMNLRDWLIFRDYMNGLEFVIQVFEHLLIKLEH